MGVVQQAKRKQLFAFRPKTTTNVYKKTASDDAVFVCWF
jgi:hypothetical protein